MRRAPIRILQGHLLTVGKRSCSVMNCSRSFSGALMKPLAARSPYPAPFCGSDPPLGVRIAGRIVVGYENENGVAPQTAAARPDEARIRWNRRAR